MSGRLTRGCAWFVVMVCTMAWVCLCSVVFAEVAKPAGSEPGTSGPRHHLVRTGETLSHISRRYRVSTAQLRQWNQLRGDRINVGQKLRVWVPADLEYYLVRKGDTLSAIGASFGVSTGALRSLNRLDGDRIVPGQKLRLRTPPPADRVDTDGVYTVQRGDTLSEIALRHNLSLKQLRRLNPPLRGDRIKAGDGLRVRQPPRPDEPKTPADPVEAVEYVVKRGDTLSEIAERADVGLVLLRQLNHLTGDRIRPGQKLKLRPSRKDEGVHVVHLGETLSEIALLYGLGLKDLREINGIDGDHIRAGQKLRLKTTPVASHIVERGDALWEIARAYGMRISELKALNGIVSDRIYPGQELRLNAGAAKRLAAYTVLRGDNLSEIARLHQMSVAELVKLNRLRGSVIHPGQTLQVRPMLGGTTEWLKLADIRWSDLQIAPMGVHRINAENGPYFGSRPKADQQRATDYYEEHPRSPLKTYRAARKLWERFQRTVDGLGHLSDDLRGWHVVLDPGHGGLDPGAVVRTTDGAGNKLYVVEDEYVYDIALRTYVLLRLHGAAVDMTLLSPNHLIRQNSPPARTFVNEKNEVYNSYEMNRSNRRSDWPSGSRSGLARRVGVAKQIFGKSRRDRRIFLSFHADIDPRSPEAPLILYYQSRDGRRRDLASRSFAQGLLPALGAGARARGQGLGVLRDNPAGVKVLVELRNLAYVDHAWALRYEQLRHRDAEKLVRGVLDYVRGQRLSAKR